MRQKEVQVEENKNTLTDRKISVTYNFNPYNHFVSMLEL